MTDFDITTRGHSDNDIIAQAAQPDIPYIGDVQLMDVAQTLGYTYADYVCFARACKRHCYSAVSYTLHKQFIEIQAQDYLNNAVLP